MNERERLLRQLPKMDGLLNLAEGDGRFAGTSRGALAEALRGALEELRRAILQGTAESLSPDAAILDRAHAILEEGRALSQRRIINATGVLLHTNLGRALLAREALAAVEAVGGSYSSLEFDCSTGKRGDRYQHVEGILRELLGVESALVVNNNAAAVMLVLSAMAKGREVVVSRGELVEIGGSFRVPEVMEQSGCILREVGATNKTHLQDYLRAIGENTAALLKVHTSNYRIVGFTGDVSLLELAALAKERGLPLIYDLGGGSMLPLAPYGVQNEPTVGEVAKSADVLCFSGDKLLGGPQAGVIVGKSRWIDPMKAHPLLRALRVDKMTLGALEATLRLYRHPEEAMAKIPLYRMLGEPLSQVEARGRRLVSLLEGKPPLCPRLVESRAQIGAGSVPCEDIPSMAVALGPEGVDAQALSQALLRAKNPVAARVHRDTLLLDMRTVGEGEVPALAEAILAAVEGDL